MRDDTLIPNVTGFPGDDDESQPPVPDTTSAWTIEPPQRDLYPGAPGAKLAPQEVYPGSPAFEQRRPRQ